MDFLRSNENDKNSWWWLHCCEKIKVFFRGKKIAQFVVWFNGLLMEGGGTINWEFGEIVNEYISKFCYKIAILCDEEKLILQR